MKNIDKYRKLQETYAKFVEQLESDFFEKLEAEVQKLLEKGFNPQAYFEEKSKKIESWQKKRKSELFYSFLCNQLTEEEIGKIFDLDTEEIDVLDAPTVQCFGELIDNEDNLNIIKQAITNIKKDQKQYQGLNEEELNECKTCKDLKIVLGNQLDKREATYFGELSKSGKRKITFDIGQDLWAVDTENKTAEIIERGYGSDDDLETQAKNLTILKLCN